MQYSELLASSQIKNQSVHLDLPESWLQGRSMFGGLQAALAVRAMRTLAPELPLRTLQTTFMAPIPAGPVSAQATLLRQGKNTQHIQATIQDGDQVQAICIGVFGNARQSSIERRITAPEIPNKPGIDFEYVEGVTPNFTQYFSARWLAGDLPFSNSSFNHALIDVSMTEPGNTSESHLFAIADFIPPVALAKLKTPAAGSSLTWMLEFLDHSYVDQPLDHWLVDAEMTAAGDGYTSQTATIFAPNGIAAALSRQSMVVFG